MACRDLHGFFYLFIYLVVYLFIYLLICSFVYWFIYCAFLLRFFSFPFELVSHVSFRGYTSFREIFFSLCFRREALNACANEKGENGVDLFSDYERKERFTAFPFVWKRKYRNGRFHFLFFLLFLSFFFFCFISNFGLSARKEKKIKLEKQISRFFFSLQPLIFFLFFSFFLRDCLLSCCRTCLPVNRRSSDSTV